MKYCNLNKGENKMKFPQKIEINVENELQAALLYSCFNKSFRDVMFNLGKSRKPYARDLYYKYKYTIKDNDNFIMKCWEKVDNIFEKKEEGREIKNNENKRLAKIKVESFFKGNEEYYKILEFENIRQEKQLPKKYLVQSHVFFLTQDKLSIYITHCINSLLGHRSFYYLVIGSTIKKSEFDRILNIIKKAGEQLTQIKKEERKQYKKEGDIKEFII